MPTAGSLEAAILAQSPTLCIPMGSGSFVDTSANGNNMTGLGVLAITASPLYPTKNPGLAATIFAPGTSDYLSRATIPANVNSKLMNAQGGGEWEVWFKCASSTSNMDLIDTRNSSGNNGLTVRFNGEAAGSKFILYAIDSSGGLSQYTFLDGSAPFHRDGLWHRLIVAFRSQVPGGGGGEAAYFELDRHEITPTGVTVGACAGAGTFTDHANPMEFGKQRGSAVYWDGIVQIFANFPRWRTTAERRTTFAAGCYDIGDGIGCGLNGVLYADLSGTVYKDDALTAGQESTADRDLINSIPNKYGVAIGDGTGTTGRFKNSAGTATSPRLRITPNSKRALRLDNWGQSAHAAHRQYLKATWPYAALVAARLNLSVYGVARTCRLIGIGAMQVVSVSKAGGTAVGGSEDLQSLASYNGRPVALSRGSLPEATSGTAFLKVPCEPGPALFGASFGNFTITGGRLFNHGAASAFTVAIDSTYDTKPEITIGCWQGGANGFDGHLHEVLVEACPIADADAVIREAFFDTKWGTRRLVHYVVGHTSIETGNPSGGEAAASDDTSPGFMGLLPAALYGVATCCALPVGGSYSGRLYRVLAGASGCVWDNTTKTLTKIGLFAGVDITANLVDTYVTFSSGTGAPISAAIMAKTSDDVVVLKAIDRVTAINTANAANWVVTNVYRAFSGNSSFPGTEQGFDEAGSYATGIPNVLAVEPWTNDALQAEQVNNGNHTNIAAQSEANLATIIAQARAIDPTCKVCLLMFPSDAAFDSSGLTATQLKADAATLPNVYSVTYFNGLPSGTFVHPTGGLTGSGGTNDYLYMGGLVAGPLAAAGGIVLGSVANGFRSFTIGIGL